MRRILLVLLILAFGASEADARRGRHRHHRHHGVVVVMPGGPAGLSPLERLRAPPRGRYGAVARSPEENTGFVTAAMPDTLAPPGWKLQPADPQWDGRRYVAPDGAAWLAVYATPAEPEALAAHMRTIAFADGEEISYLRGEHDWIAVSGRKGERIFYRKAVLACAGKRWQHVAFEYPAEAKRTLDPHVAKAARALDPSADHGCEPITTPQQ
jgi:serine/threonine-protein kinase